MAFDDRLTWLMLGVVIGFFAGYITRTLREIKEEIHEVDEIVKSEWHEKHDEAGAISFPSWPNIALLIVIMATGFAAFQSQEAANKVTSTQDELIKTQNRLESVVSCNKELLGQALTILNARTRASEEAARANLQLQKSQSLMFDVLLHVPPYGPEREAQSLKIYSEDLKAFVDAGGLSQFTAKANRYPKASDLIDCIEDKSGG